MTVELHIDLWRMCFYLGRGHEHTGYWNICLGVHLSMFIDRNVLQKCVHILISWCPSINPALEVVKTDEWKVRTQSTVKGIQQCWAASCSSIEFDLRLSPTINPLITALMSQWALCWAKGKHKSSQLWGLLSSLATFSVNLYIVFLLSGCTECLLCLSMRKLSLEPILYQWLVVYVL